MQVGRSVSSQTKNNESFTIRDPGVSDECAGILSSHSFTNANATPRGELSVLTSSFSNLDKGETVDAAGSTRGACWSCGVVVGLFTIDPTVFICVCMVNQAGPHCC